MREEQKFETKNPVVENNVRMLETNMEEELFQESIGGNAGFYEEGGKKYSCGAVTCYLDPSTGNFKAFWGDLPTAEEQGKLSGTVECIIRVALDIPTGSKKIVEVRKPNTLSLDVARVIDESVGEYNRKKWPTNK